MKFILFVAFFFSPFTFATDGQEIFELKKQYEDRAYELKIEREKEAVKLQNKEDASLFSFLNLKTTNSNMECIEFVYRGTATRDQAIRACQGVTSIQCVEFVYRGTSTREESARACQGVRVQECVEFVYRGTATRDQSARACQGVSDMSCVEFAYRGTSSREESARQCSYHRPTPPRNPNC